MPQPAGSSPMSTRAGTLKRLLQGRTPFDDWPDDRFTALEGHCRVIEVDAQVPLLEQGSVDPHIHFLLNGAVKLVDVDGKEHRVDQGSADARYPIGRLRPAVFSIESIEPSSLLLIEQAVLRRLTTVARAESEAPRFDLFGRVSGGSWMQHPLVHSLYKAMREQTLSLPVIPGVALKVRRALTNDNYQLSDITRIIAADPVISARLLHLANSPVFRGLASCDSLQAAVVRLGVHKVQNLVLALSTAGMFKSSNKLINQHLGNTWRHLVDVGALTASLARMQGVLDPDIALLAGLLHEIGKIPILERAADYPDLLQHPGLLEDTLTGLCPQVSAATLSQWELAPGVIAASERQHEWSYDHEGDTDYADLLIVAHVHALTRKREQYQLPRLAETPALARITGAQLSAKESLQIVKDAQAETQALKQLLT
ncbi:MAG: HDOD domain-containing protein [Pseudomonadales bacterium]